MALVTTKEMFKKAYEGHYAIGAFNVNNMEIVQGITEAAKELNAPLILQCSAGARKYAKHQYLVHLVQAAIEDTGLPIALHLDHGADFETCKSCIDGGFTSVMFDGSHYSFKENIEKTKEVVEYAHAHGVVVEAELGQLAGIEDDVKVAAHEAHYTDPNEVEEFVKETGVDSLAIAIGTSHGAYKFKGDPYLDFDRLKKVGELLPDFPIVLHGGSGIPDDQIQAAIKLGVAKVNVNTECQIAFANATRQFVREYDANEAEYDKKKLFDPRKFLKPGFEAITAAVEERIDVFGSEGKA